MKTSLWIASGVLAAWLHVEVEAAEPVGGAVRLFVPDGQLKSHPIRVFIDRDVSEDTAPALSFLSAQADTRSEKWRTQEFPAMLVARDQTWTEKVYDPIPGLKGTLLFFDLGSKFKMPFYEAVERVTPVLSWKEPSAATDNATTHRVVAANEVYLGSIVGALLWTSVVMLALAGAVGWSCQRWSQPAWILFVNPDDGHLSLWRAQLVAWTLAIGSVVFIFGLTQLELPRIPESLVALMGLSVATGGLSCLGSTRQKKKPPAAVPPNPRPVIPVAEPFKKGWRRLSELVCEFSAEHPDGEFSIARAQMLFWTVLMLVLFLVKGLQESKPWAVPWEMVALMGISQAGYVGPKFFSDSPPAAVDTRNRDSP